MKRQGEKAGIAGIALVEGIELLFIQRYDEVKKAIQQIVDMPDKSINLMILYLHQNNSVFPKRRRDSFPKLTEEEILRMQGAFRKVFEMAVVD